MNESEKKALIDSLGRKGHFEVHEAVGDEFGHLNLLEILDGNLSDQDLLSYLEEKYAHEPHRQIVILRATGICSESYYNALQDFIKEPENLDVHWKQPAIA